MSAGWVHYTGADLEADSFGADDEGWKHYTEEDLESDSFGPDEDETRRCVRCGDDLSDVEWLFDPCPASPDGDHSEQVTP